MEFDYLESARTTESFAAHSALVTLSEFRIVNLFVYLQSLLMGQYFATDRTFLRCTVSLQMSSDCEQIFEPSEHIM